jgi:hypothetical protein
LLNNFHLDTLEQNILKELDDAEDKIKSKIDNLLKQLSQQSKTAEGIQRDITAVKEYASDLQTFDDIADIISFICLSMLHFKLSCCRRPSSDKAIMYFSSFFTSSSIALLPRKVCRSEAYSLIAIMSLCIPSTVFDCSESCFNRLYEKPATQSVRNSKTTTDISQPC